MKSIAVLLAGTALALGANAATVSYTFSNPLETTEINQTGNLGLFDSNLGVLTSASLTFTGANTTLITLTNNAANTQTVRATSSTDLFFGASSVASLNALIVAANPVLSLSATTGFQTLASGASVTFGPFPGSQSITWNSELNAILGDLSVAGGGDFALTCTSLSGIAITGGGGNIASAQSTQAGCSAAIEYTYTERTTNVPEPASLALVGIALAGLSLVRRQAKKA